MDTKLFIDKAIKIHGDRFDYSKSVYIKSKSKITIICKTHGEFLQSPDHHFRSTQCCPTCANIGRKNQPKKLKPIKSYDKFALKLKTKFGFKIRCIESSYKGITKSLCDFICSKHGKFVALPRNVIISTHGCVRCSEECFVAERTSSYSEVLKQRNKKYNNYYIYPESNLLSYKNKKSIIEIICPEHGLFTKKCQKHLSGQGCINCMDENLAISGKLPGGYSYDIFSRNIELAEQPALLYYLKINNIFYKIGITTCNIDKRIAGIKSKSCGKILNIEVVDIYSSTLIDCFTIEQYILTKYKNYRIKDFGTTEIFSKNIISSNLEAERVRVELTRVVSS